MMRVLGPVPAAAKANSSYLFASSVLNKFLSDAFETVEGG
jgi:hypothetical protein